MKLFFSFFLGRDEVGFEEKFEIGSCVIWCAWYSYSYGFPNQ